MRSELTRILSKAGLCSRKVAAEWIREGRVSVGQRIVRDPRAQVEKSAADVRVDGQRIAAAERSCWALHKPRGYVTTRRDESGRPTVYALLSEIDGWVIPIGRLDRDTSGLLLLTNDTQLAERVTNPDSHVPKTYRVEARPRLSGEAFERLRRGVRLQDGSTRPALVSKLGDRGPVTLFEITITEGRNRQVRRMVREVGSQVQKLARTSIGAVELGDLAAGAVRKLTPAEVRSLAGGGQRKPERPRRGAGSAAARSRRPIAS